MTFGIDGISLYSISLTNVLIPISILISSKSIKTFKKEFNILYICTLLLMLFFSSLNLISFYIFFQLITGIFLAMHYSGDIKIAFSSVIHITRDVNSLTDPENFINANPLITPLHLMPE